MDIISDWRCALWFAVFLALSIKFAYKTKARGFILDSTGITVILTSVTLFSISIVLFFIGFSK